MPKVKKQKINITKHIEWIPEVESEGHFWIYGHFRGSKVVVLKAAGPKALLKDIKIGFSNQGGIAIYRMMD